MYMLRLENVKIYEDLKIEDVVKKACKKYKLEFKNVKRYSIYKKAIDARDKENIFYNYTIDIEYLGKLQKSSNIKQIDFDEVNYEKDNDSSNDNICRNSENNCFLENKNVNTNMNINYKNNFRTSPVIIGAGPSGLFCALTLVQNGVIPIIIEQGKKVTQRQSDVDKFLNTGKLNVYSNVQFGEGGAGTFSDGKLTTNSKNPLCRKVLKEFVKFGAPKQILYESKPHIGTDNLVNIIIKIREYLINKGVSFYFEEKAIDFKFESGKIEKIITKNVNTGKLNEFKTDNVVLAIGHSSRDTIETLYSKGLLMEKKAFSVGVRIEHKQEMINKSQYGTKTKLKLPPAEYKLAYHGKNRSCYTFCMCPGGVVIASSSNLEEIVTNGMSKFARDEENANSALLVEVFPEDIKGDSPLSGITFQKELEHKAFIMGGSNYYAPIQRVGDFLNNRKTTEIRDIKPTYKPGVTFSNLKELFPEYIYETLEEGIIDFDKKIDGFANEDSILTAIESRSSSPVRIIRDDRFQASFKGVYPCGEGVRICWRHYDR